jgi:hypothetical protein
LKQICGQFAKFPKIAACIVRMNESDSTPTKVAFIAGKKNPAFQKFFIHFSIENLIANISFYALSWPKLNFGYYLTFEIILKLYFNGIYIMTFCNESGLDSLRFYLSDSIQKRTWQ